MVSAKAVAFDARMAFYQLSGKGIPIVYSVPRYPARSFVVPSFAVDAPAHNCYNWKLCPGFAKWWVKR